MALHFLASELSKWDECSFDTLVLTFFENERPLRGAAGLADWRLCGFLSRLVKRNRVIGKKGEDLLMPPGRRLPFERIVLLGLGSPEGFSDTRFREEVRRIRGILKKAGVTSYALQPPGRATGLMAARRALELWIDEMQSAGVVKSEDVAIIDSPSAQKEMADTMLAFQRKHGTRAKPDRSTGGPKSGDSPGKQAQRTK